MGAVETVETVETAHVYTVTRKNVQKTELRSKKAVIAATLRLSCAQPQWKWQTVRTTRATAGESVANQLRVKVKVENSVGSLGHWQWTVWAVGATAGQWTVGIFTV